MKIKFVLMACAIALSATVAGSAAAAPGLVAAWDFGTLPVAGAPFPASLSATVTGAGSTGTASATGTVTAGAYCGGGNHTDHPGITAGLDGGDFAGSVSTPVAFLVPGVTGMNAAGSTFLGITSPGTASVDFEVTGLAAGDFLRLSFGGKSLPSGLADTSTDVDVTFGASCGGSQASKTVTLTPEESETVLYVGAAPAGTGCVRFTVDGAVNQPLLDNVTVASVPEPGMVAALGAGLLGLVGLARRRQA